MKTILLPLLLLLTFVVIPQTACGQRDRQFGRREASSYDNPLLPKDADEKRYLDALTEMQQGRGYANVPQADGRFLRQLVEMIGAKRVVEIGTSTGESAVWMALGLRKTGGTLVTYEIDASRARTARDNFKKAGLDKVITLVEGDAHETVKKLTGQIDLLFLDADKDGYLDYLQKLLPLVRPGGVIVAHNMGMADPAYIESITRNPDLESTFVSVDGGEPVGVSIKKR